VRIYHSHQVTSLPGANELFNENQPTSLDKMDTITLHFFTKGRKMLINSGIINPYSEKCSSKTVRLLPTRSLPSVSSGIRVC